MGEAENPFRGLRRFEMEDSGIFFGRDEQTYDVLRRLRMLHFVAVLGPSGCGKSSLIRAGVLAALRDGYMANEDAWRIVTLQPGNGPLESWFDGLRPLLGEGMTDQDLLVDSAKALDTSGGKIVILVDQFEELFQYSARTGRDRDVRAFLTSMLAATAGAESCIYVVITMRTEYLSQCAEYPSLTEAINEGLYLVPVVTRDQMREAIVMPIRKVGAEVTAPLVDRLLNDTSGQGDPLPILQHALMRMWAKKPAWDPLGLPEYEAQVSELAPGETGGIGAFISAHAREVVSKLNPGEPDVARSLFQAITELTEDGRAVRRALPLDDIARRTGYSVNKLKPVIEAFRSAGFLNLWQNAHTDSPLVDLSHEAIARQWPDLRNWMLEALRIRRTERRIEEAAKEWELHAHDKGYLFRGLQLAEAQFLLGNRLSQLPPLSKSFVEASKADARLSLFLSRKVLPLVVVVFSVLIFLIYFSFRQRNSAMHQAEEAQRQRKAAVESLNAALKAQTEYSLTKREADTLQEAAADISRPAPAPKPKAPSTPQIFVQFLSDGLRDQANAISDQLREGGYQVPGTEKVAVGPSNTELRYFRAKDKDTAAHISSALTDLHFSAKVVYVPGFESSSKVKEGQFELWLAAPSQK